MVDVISSMREGFNSRRKRDPATPLGHGLGRAKHVDEASSLDLSRRCLRDIESFLPHHRHLRCLTIHASNLCKIPGALPPSLERLDLSRNVIQSTQGLERCRNLKFVRLDHNALHTLLPGLSHARKVIELYASHNQIRSLDGLHSLHKMKVLDVRFNQLGKMIPLSVFSLFCLLCFSMALTMFIVQSTLMS